MDTTNADPDLDMILRRLLRGRSHATATGTHLYGYPMGALFVMLNADRRPGNPFPPEVNDLAHPITESLATLCLWRRRVSSVMTSPWREMGSFHAPVGCARELLGVMLALDAGDLAPARAIAEMVAAGNAALESAPAMERKRVAVAVVTDLERDIPAALAAPRR